MLVVRAERRKPRRNSSNLGEEEEKIRERRGAGREEGESSHTSTIILVQVQGLRASFGVTAFR